MANETIKMNSSENYDSVMIKVADHPTIYKAKLEELIEQGWSETEAKNWLKDAEIELELYYHKHSGLFAVEAEAVESCSGGLFSPYDGTTELVQEDDDDLDEDDDEDLDF